MRVASKAFGGFVTKIKTHSMISPLHDISTPLQLQTFCWVRAVDLISRLFGVSVTVVAKRLKESR